MLRYYFPTTDEGCKLYDGFFAENFLFCRIFQCKNTLVEMLVDVNIFLIDNGYEEIKLTEINNEVYSYDKFPISLSPHGYQEEFVLFIKREHFAKTQTQFLINELIKFRDDRDWKQFHNPKDLSIALSIESNELLEQFLWKTSSEANIVKLKEELADVFTYALLLAEKLEFDVEEIVLQKIVKNAEKYPISKAKGTSKKYNEL